MEKYTYKCADCGNIFDVEATIQEKEEGKSEKFTCPVCKSKKNRQDFSAVNFLRNVFRSDNKKGGCGNSNGGCCG